jgi:hypothetical protein
MNRGKITPPSHTPIWLSFGGGTWSWRFTAADGSILQGQAADLETACRTGAFAGAVAEALARTQQRRF